MRLTTVHIFLFILTYCVGGLFAQHIHPFSTATKAKELSLYKAEDVDIFYTLDGTTPTQKSRFFPDSLILKKSASIKYIVYKDEKWEGPFTQHYIVGHAHQFPIVSINSSQKDLFDKTTGIYMKGCCADTVSPYFGANFWEDKEIATHIAFFTPNSATAQHELKIHQGAGLKIFGGYSRSLKQKSFALYARQEYGKGSFKYPFFKNKSNIKSFESLILRNSGSDFNRTQFRDIALSQSARHLNIDYQEALSTVVYINGYYWGIMNLREKINEHFLASNHPQISTPSIDMLKKHNDLKLGSDRDYLALLDFIKEHNLAYSYNYEHVAQQIDIPNYINYSIFQIYINNKDAGGNVRYYRSSDWDNKWRWILFDTDFAYGLSNSYSYRQNSLESFTKDTTISWPHPSWSTFLLRNLLKNDQFKAQFTNYFCDQLNTTFNAKYIVPIIDSLEEAYEKEMPMHLKRWRILSKKWDKEWPEKHMRIWYKNVNVLRHYANKRTKYMFKHLKQFMDYGYGYTFKFDSVSTQMGYVQLNSIKQSKQEYTYLSELPIVLTAIPKMDYEFVQWSNGNTNTSIAVLPENAAPIYPIFKSKRPSEIFQQLKFTEIQFRGSVFESGDWIEISNCSKKPHSLKGFSLRDSKDLHHFVIQQDIWLQPYESIVICEDTIKFKNVYKDNKIRLIGDLDFAFKGYGEQLRFYDSTGYLIDYLEVFDIAEAYDFHSISLINYHTNSHQLHHWLFTNEKEIMSPGYINPYMKRLLEQEQFQKEKHLFWKKTIISILAIIGVLIIIYSIYIYFQNK